MHDKLEVKVEIETRKQAVKNKNFVTDRENDIIRFDCKLKSPN